MRTISNIPVFYFCRENGKKQNEIFRSISPSLLTFLPAKSTFIT
jgi:hypothetical protein